MKILLLSGFLGSGKTTFIQALTKYLTSVAILENDYAKANVDAQLLKDTSKDIYSLEEGCICCSKKTDFASSVLTIANTLNPEYLIVEPTGVGYLSNVINNIKKSTYEQVSLLAPITIVDYCCFDKSLKEFPELMSDQLRSAGVVLISKTENTNLDDIEKCAKKISKYTNAKIYTDHYSSFDKETFLSLLQPYNDVDVEEVDGHVDLTKYTYENVYFEDFNECGTYLNAICDGRFGRVIRAKGIVSVGKYSAKIDIIDGTYEIKPYDSDYREFIVIGKNLDRKAFNILLKQKQN